MSMTRKFAAGITCLALFAGVAVPACKAEEKKKTPAEKAKDDANKPYNKMDYGPYLSASIISDPAGKFTNDTGAWSCDMTPRGFAIRLTDDWTAGVVFDSDTMRYSAGWIGAHLKFTGLIGDGAHGPGPTLGSKPIFQTPYGPGWADKTGSFKDPREDYIKPLPPPGNLPADWAKYKGLYLYGNQTVLSYTVGKCAVLETPSLETSGDVKAFARTFQLGPSEDPLALMVAEVKDGKGSVDNGVAHLGELHAALVDAPAGAQLEVADGQMHLKIPQLKDTTRFKLLIAGGGDAAKDGFTALVKASAKPADLTPMTKGGPPRWKETVETAGVLGGDSEPYVIDKITIPYKNPYDSWMRVAAFDFFSDGTTAAVTTWSGDVWIVSGIDDKLDHLKWKRFATGLHQPLGLKIVDDVIYTVGHDQITRLRDLNGDGEADFYECFNNSWDLTSAFHAFAFDLHTDADGNFYFGFGSPVHAGGGGFQKITRHHGSILKISKDGSKMEQYATGLRAPNGMCVSPTGQVTIGDNEGSWVPTSPVHWVKPGMFLGVADSAHGAKVEQPKPLCWIPHNSMIDNSCGGQAWVTSDKWGPFKGELLHESYGTSSLFLVMKEELNGQMQGGVVKFPLKFTSSTMRARFNSKDGQLYVSGLKGWQTNAVNDGGFDRVRYTGKAVHMPSALHVSDKGVYVTFTSTVDPATANDPQNFAVEEWNYRWTSSYGSGEVSVSDDKGHGDKAKPVHDTLNPKSSKLLSDGKTVFIELPDMKPAMQMKLTMKLKSADGAALNHTIYNTIYNMAPDQGHP